MFTSLCALLFCAKINIPNSKHLFTTYVFPYLHYTWKFCWQNILMIVIFKKKWFYLQFILLFIFQKYYRFCLNYNYFKAIKTEHVSIDKLAQRNRHRVNEIIYYVPFPFTTLVIRALHYLRSFLTINKYCLSVISRKNFPPSIDPRSQDNLYVVIFLWNFPSTPSSLCARGTSAVSSWC